MKTLKLSFLFVLMCLCTIFGFACGSEGSNSSSEESSIEVPRPEFSIEFVQDEISLTVGESVQAELDLSNENTFVFWSIRDNDLAKISDTGLITALAEGETVCYAEARGKTASCPVRISPKPIKSISVDAQKTNFSYGDKFVFDGNVSIEYMDGTTENDYKNYTVDSSAYDPLKLGTYEINMTIRDKEYSYNVTVQKRKTLKFLMIGNSFAQDTSTMMPVLMKNLNFDEIIIGNLVIGGCTISTHYQNSQTNADRYRFELYEKANGSWIVYDDMVEPKTMEYGVTYTDWDFISLQQVSQFSGKPETYNHELDGLIDYVKATATNKNVQLIWNMTWAYANGYPNLAEYYNNNQMTMYNAITSTVQSKILTNPNFLTLSVAGTAIQNARTSYLGDTLNRDLIHLSLDVGRYISALTMLCTLTGYTPNEITYRSSDMDQKEYLVAIESVKNALENRFSVTNSQYVD